MRQHGSESMKHVRRFGAVLAVAVVLSACGSGDSDTEEAASAAPGDDGPVVTVSDPTFDRVAEIKERGTLRVGMTLQFEPQMYRDDNNEPAGYDVVLVNKLAEDLGVELEISDLEFPALIPGMLAGQFDMISVGLVNRPARAELMGFTRPYVPYRQVVLVNSGKGFTSLDELNSSSVTFAALEGSTAAQRVIDNFPNAQLAERDQAAAFLEVASGRVDAMIVEEYLARGFMAENSGVEVLGGPLSQSYGRWAVPRGDVLWLQYVDNWLDFYTASGDLDRWYEETVGPTEGLPGS
jgi:ABC-type amino acid transport substrate-binding protein